MKSGVRSAAAAAAALVLITLSGCASVTGNGPSSEDHDGDATEGSTLTVFAAASLRGAFTDLADLFEAQNPGIDVRFSFAGSSDLASQIIQGAPADVFAAADPVTMGRVQEAGLTQGQAAPFASNTLAIAVPVGNPAGITGFRDLARPGLKLVVCARQVPCGAAARKLGEQAKVSMTPVSEENSVTDVLGKVTSGEADAGLVYATDVQAAGERLVGIEFPESAGAVNSYPIAAMEGAPRREAAEAFIRVVTGPQGQQILAAAGFGPAQP